MLSIILHSIIILLLVFNVYGYNKIGEKNKINYIPIFISENKIKMQHTNTQIIKKTKHLEKIAIHKQKMEKKVVRAHESPGDYSALLIYLHNKIQADEAYPKIATELNQTGVVELQFLLQPNGMISNLTIKTSSGYQSLDQAAINAMHMATPFVQTKTYLHKPEWFSLPVVFK